MNKNRYLLLLCIAQTSTLQLGPRIDKSLQKVHSFFNRYSTEIIEHKEFPTASFSTISIENQIGSITIKTCWDKKYLCLKTVKRAKKKNDLKTIKIVADRTKPNQLSIKTVYTTDKSRGSVDYELIIPAYLHASLSTEQGTIDINDMKGTARAITHHGEIIVNNAESSVYAVTKTGNIAINAGKATSGNINAVSEYGSVVITNASSSITAQSTKGKITIDYKELPSTGKINLTTVTGNIALALPTHTSATIHGTSSYGTVTSDHPITLNAYTTKLNQFAWKTFKKEVHGVVGSGDADISLCSTHGNIRLLETKRT